MKKNFLLGILLCACAAISFLAFRGPDMKQKMRFNHLALFVYDLNKSTVFYRDVLQVDTIANPFNDGKHTWFNIGDHCQLHIISGNAKEQPHVKDTHLCLSVGSLDEIMKRLDANSINYSNWKGEGKTPTLRADGVRQIYLQDPDGYWLEINDDKY